MHEVLKIDFIHIHAHPSAHVWTWLFCCCMPTLLLYALDHTMCVNAHISSGFIYNRTHNSVINYVSTCCRISDCSPPALYSHYYGHVKPQFTLLYKCLIVTRVWDTTYLYGVYSCLLPFTYSWPSWCTWILIIARPRHHLHNLALFRSMFPLSHYLGPHKFWWEVLVGGHSLGHMSR